MQDHTYQAGEQRLVSHLPVEYQSVPLCYVREQTGGQRRVELSGDLGPHWPLRLARAFAEHRVSLQSGFARRAESGVWLARLEVELPRPDATTPDFLTFALQSGRGPARVDPPILDFDISRSASAPDVLELEVHAWDAVGLLAGVLHQIAESDLAPVELVLETEEDCAFHRICVGGKDGSQPTRRQRASLAGQLSHMMRSG